MNFYNEFDPAAAAMFIVEACHAIQDQFNTTP
jgi:hypothetical protein